MKFKKVLVTPQLARQWLDMKKVHFRDGMRVDDLIGSKFPQS